MLTIRLFGAPQITHDQRPVTISRRKSRALIYYLAAHSAPLTRDHLLAFFWPDHERPTAQQNLRTTLYGLRKIFGSLLLADEDTLALSAEAEVDVRTFESRLSPLPADIQALKETLDLYRGDFLSGFTLPDLPEFDDWAAVERERYRRLAVTGLSRLSQLYEARRDYRAGLEALERALAFDPLQEDLQRQALRLHYLAGDRAGAIRRYESFRQLLSEEMGVPPMDETRAVYDAIITDSLSPGIEPAASPPPAGSVKPRRALAVTALPFVGREAELQKLEALATASKLVLIEGEPGIGKSRLMEEFLQRRGESALVLAGQARELEATLPYQPIIESLREVFSHPDWPTLRSQLNLPSIWLVEITRLLPELAPAGYDPAAGSHSTDEIRLWEGVSQFVLALARQVPLILALDDLHWADSATLGLLGYLIRKADQNNAPIFFVATAHPARRTPLGPPLEGGGDRPPLSPPLEGGGDRTPLSPLAAGGGSPVSRSALVTLLASLAREGRLERLNLNRLSGAEIMVLARQLSPDQAGPLAGWLSQGSEGNPFVLAEMIRYARENGLLLPGSGFDLSRLPEGPVVPPTIYSLIQVRLARLAEADWQTLNAAVAIGREFEFEVVARAAGLSEAATLDSLDRLQGLGLIHPLGGSWYRFDHHLMMEVAFQEISEPRHRLAHRRVAEAMESVYRQRLDSVAGLLAQHYAEGGVPEQAAKYAFRAGQLAADLAAWQEAIGFFEQALALHPSYSPLGEGEQGGKAASGDLAQRQTILAALGQACLHAGRFNRAAEVVREALDLSRAGHDSVNRGVLHLNLGEALVMANRTGELLALAEEISTGTTPEAAVNAAYFRGVALSLSRADLTGAIAQIHQAEALLQQLQPKPGEGVVTLGQLQFELGNILARRGDLPAAIEAYRAGLEATPRMETEAVLRNHILFYNNLAYHLHLLGDPAAAGYARQGLALAQEKGVLSVLPYLYSTLGEIALAEGDLDAAEQHFNEGLTLARQFSIPERVAGLTANLGLVARQRRQPMIALRYLSEALTEAEALNLRHLAVQIRLWLAPLLSPAEARVHLAAARAIAEHDGYDLLLGEADRVEAEV